MVVVNAVQLHEHSGPYYERWLRRTIMVAHRRLLDAERAAAQTAGD